MPASRLALFPKGELVRRKLQKVPSSSRFLRPCGDSMALFESEHRSWPPEEAAGEDLQPSAAFLFLLAQAEKFG